MWQTIGQSALTGMLARAISSGRLSHAYLIVGPPHVGKMTLALDLAAAANCEQASPPCGECSACRRILSGKHPDVQVLEQDPEHKRNIGIDKMHELRRDAFLPPFEGKRKVFVIDGADRLSPEAANCLLKTLEEPPPGVVLLLLAVREADVFLTLSSRCQRLQLRPLAVSTVKGVVGERFGLGDEQAEVLARLSRGRLGWAISATQDAHILESYSEEIAVVNEVSAAGRVRRMEYASQLAAKFGHDRAPVSETLDRWEGWWHDLMLARSGNMHHVVHVNLHHSIEEQKDRYTLIQIQCFLRLLRIARKQLEQNANAQLVLENLMLALPEPRLTLDHRET